MTNWALMTHLPNYKKWPFLMHWQYVKYIYYYILMYLLKNMLLLSCQVLTITTDFDIWL